MNSKCTGKIEKDSVGLGISIERFIKNPVTPRMIRQQYSRSQEIKLFKTDLSSKVNFNCDNSNDLLKSDNLTREEAGRLICSLEGALMTLEDFRSSDLRRSTKIPVNCSQSDLLSFYSFLTDSLGSSRLDLTLGDTRFIINVGDYPRTRKKYRDVEKLKRQTGELLIQQLAFKQRTEKFKEQRQVLEQYNSKIKMKTVQLIKDKDKLEKSKREMKEQQSLLEEA